MKAVAFVALAVLSTLLATVPASAQCYDQASCIGQKAEINVRLTQWATQTIAALPTQTPKPPTITPTSTATATSSVTPTERPTTTSTPQPVATATSEPIKQAQQAAPAVSVAPWWMRWVITGVGVPALLVAMFWILAKFRRVI